MPVYLSADVRCCMLGCVLHVMGCTKMMTRWWCEGLHACICTACGGLHHDGDEVQMWGAAWWYMSCMTWAAQWCWLGADVRGCMLVWNPAWHGLHHDDDSCADVRGFMVVYVLHDMGCTMMLIRSWCEEQHGGICTIPIIFSFYEIPKLIPPRPAACNSCAYLCTLEHTWNSTNTNTYKDTWDLW